MMTAPRNICVGVAAEYLKQEFFVLAHEDILHAAQLVKTVDVIIQITVVTISRMLRCSSRSSVMGEQSATSEAATAGMPRAIIWAA